MRSCPFSWAAVAAGATPLCTQELYKEPDSARFKQNLHGTVPRALLWNEDPGEQPSLSPVLLAVLCVTFVPTTVTRTKKSRGVLEPSENRAVSWDGNRYPSKRTLASGLVVFAICCPGDAVIGHGTVPRGVHTRVTSPPHRERLAGTLFRPCS